MLHKKKHHKKHSKKGRKSRKSRNLIKLSDDEDDKEDSLLDQKINEIKELLNVQTKEINQPI